MTESLKDKVVLVTGAGRRIGRSIALAAGEQGARVAVHYNRSEDEARRVAEQCGGRTFQADLADLAQIERLFDEVRQAYGRLDRLVNNAAVYFKTPIEEATEEQWDRIHSSNLKQVYFCCKHAAALMRAQGDGRIVNLSSLGGLRPWERYGPYNASKAGVVHLTRSLAKELAPEIQVNSVAPGVIVFEEKIEGMIRSMIEATPMRTHGTGAELAAVVLFFLTCPKYVTGQILAVDGGLSLRA